MNTTVKTGPKNPGRVAQGKPPEPRQGHQARPARPGRTAAPPRPTGPVRLPHPAAPADPAGPVAPGPRTAARLGQAYPAPARAADPARDTRGAERRSVSRTPFILLVLGLLGGGLVCLLVINTTLAAAAYQIGNLQRSNAAATQQVQELQQQVASEQSPGSIEQRALQLGMRTQQVLNFIDLKTGRRYTMPSRAQGAYAAPGYTP